METVKCKCGKASMTYKVIGEDLWTAEAKNTVICPTGYIKTCICMGCKESYSQFDPCMVKDIIHT